MNSIQVISAFLSFFALIISGITFWMTLYRKGKIKMTQPSQIFLGVDGDELNGRKGSSPKVVLSALLYSTAKKGWVIEGLFVKVSHNDSQYNFDVWVHYDRISQKLVRSSGLLVDGMGVATSHHFLLNPIHNRFEFNTGEYTLEFCVKLVGKIKTKVLNKTTLYISESETKKLKKSRGIYFDWASNSNKYTSYVNVKIP